MKSANTDFIFHNKFSNSEFTWKNLELVITVTKWIIKVGKHMTIREKYILNLIESGETINIDTIAEKLNVSSRTIRNDLDNLQEYISGIIKRKIDIDSIVLSEDEINALKENSQTVDYYAEKLSVEERILLILFDLCSIPKCITIQQIADKYYISRGTVNSDLITIKNYCKENGIKLITQKGKGVYVEASENERRNYLTKIIRNYEQVINYSYEQRVDDYNQWFTDIDIDKLKEIVIRKEEEYGVMLNDISFDGLVLHIALAIKRYKNDDTFKSDEIKDIKLDDKSYEMSSSIIKEINNSFNLSMPDSEIYYVALHIGNMSALVNQDDFSFLDYVVLDLMKDVGNSINFNFIEDKKLYEGLFQHLSSGVYRAKNKMYLHNPLKEELIQEYPYLFSAIKESLHNHQRNDILLESDDEIAYVALHFAASLTRNNNSKQIANVVIVCSTGRGTSELVSSIVKKNFNINVKATIALHQLKNYLEKQQCDLVISTVTIPYDMEYVQVRPMLQTEDFIHIREKLSKLGFDNSSPQNDNSTINQTARVINDLVKKYCHPNEENQLIRSLQMYCQEISRKSINKGETKMLKDILTENDMELNVKADDWQNAVQKAGDLLINDGSITQDYINGVIKNMKEMGPYFVITKGVALPHTTNKCGVNKTCMSFIRLLTPIEFGNANNDPVEFIFMLATTDSTSHLGALQDLAEFLGRKEFMSLLHTAKNTHSIADYISANAQ